MRPCQHAPFARNLVCSLTVAALVDVPAPAPVVELVDVVEEVEERMVAVLVPVLARRCRVAASFFKQILGIKIDTGHVFIHITFT